MLLIQRHVGTLVSRRRDVYEARDICQHDQGGDTMSRWSRASREGTDCDLCFFPAKRDAVEVDGEMVGARAGRDVFMMDGTGIQGQGSRVGGGAEGGTAVV